MWYNPYVCDQWQAELMTQCVPGVSCRYQRYLSSPIVCQCCHDGDIKLLHQHLIKRNQTTTQTLALYIMTDYHYGVIKWKHFPRNWPFVRGIHRSQVVFSSQRPVTRSFGIFLDLRRNKRLSKQSRCRWFETSSRSLKRHGNAEVLREIYPIKNVYCFAVLTSIIFFHSVSTWWNFIFNLSIILKFSS